MSRGLRDFFKYFVWGVFFLTIFGCCGLEKSEKGKVRKKNRVFEYIHRTEKDVDNSITDLEISGRDRYPWERDYGYITKENFRCKGSFLNVPVDRACSEGDGGLTDCGGGFFHSLPLRNGDEFIYPILLDILNYIQRKFDRRVVVTSGHSCLKHILYCGGELSKHMIGGEVDFYVEGKEYCPDDILSVIMQFYESSSRYRNNEEYINFYKKHGEESIYYNKEISVRIYNEEAGRDFDNRHKFPYLSIKVEYDRDLCKAIKLSDDKW